jgi:uncharacterized membrane protein
VSDGDQSAGSCRECGAQTSGARFCHECGTRLDAAPNTTKRTGAAGSSERPVKTTGSRRAGDSREAHSPGDGPKAKRAPAADPSTARLEKRDQFLGHRKSRRRPLVFTAAGLVVLAAVAAVLAVVLTGGSNAKTVQASTPSGGSTAAAAATVSLPLAKVTTNAAFYAMDAGGTQVKFFMMKASDGKIRTAFDACQVCYAKKKGYHQEGDVMVCNNCGRRFPSAEIDVERGGCNPVPLESQTAGGKILFPTAALQAGVQLFQ